jgi:hypothetical protein
MMWGRDGLRWWREAGESVGQCHSFVLHLCPIPKLDAMLASYRGNLCHIWDDDDNRDAIVGRSSGRSGMLTIVTSGAILEHAWLNTSLAIHLP